MRAGSSFLRSTAILAAAGIIAKITGAVYRIPVANLLGTEGSGYYGMAYPVFSALSVISTLGIPTAISQLVAARLGDGDGIGAARLLRVSMYCLIVLGGCLSAVFLLLAPYLADWMDAPPAQAGFRAVAPAFVLVSAVSGLRGYLQGYQEMVPTAVSQIVEQMGKLLFGLSFAALATARGVSPAGCAAAALFGITCAEAAALVSVSVSYARSPVRQRLTAPKPARRQGREDVRALVAMALPVTLGACIMPVILSLDSFQVSPALQAGGLSQRDAASQVGILTMNVAPFVNLPSALSAAVAMSVVPALADSAVREDPKKQEPLVQMAMRVAFCIAIPCAAGYALLARPILELLFSSLGPTELDTAARLLTIMSFSVFFLVVVQTMTGILQGVGHQVLPVYALVAGGVLKAALSPWMVERVGVDGAAWTSCICFGTTLALDVLFVNNKLLGFKKLMSSMWKPLLSGAVMAGAAAAAFFVLHPVSLAIAVAGAVLLGAVVYLYLLCRFGSVGEDEFALLPGGRVLARAAKKLHAFPEKKAE